MGGPLSILSLRFGAPAVLAALTPLMQCAVSARLRQNIVAPQERRGRAHVSFAHVDRGRQDQCLPVAAARVLAPPMSLHLACAKAQAVAREPRLLMAVRKVSCSLPSRSWRFSGSSNMLAMSSSVEPVLTGHCGGDGERCDAQPEGSGDVAIAAAPVA